MSLGQDIVEAIGTLSDEEKGDMQTIWEVIGEVIRVGGGSIEWNSIKIYKKEDIVEYGGELYVSLKNGNENKQPDMETEWWENYLGTLGIGWSSLDSYSTGAIVSYGGQLYTALQDSTNKQPDTETAYWIVYRAIQVKENSILSGAVDSEGLLTYLEEDDPGDIEIRGASTPLDLAFADGFDSRGFKDYIKRISSDDAPANWANLFRAGWYYLYADYNVLSQVVTYDKTRIRPHYGINIDSVKENHSLLHCEGSAGGTTLTDEWGHTWVMTSGAKTDTAQKKFGTASINNFYAAASGYSYTTDILHQLQRPFTMECWIRPNDVTPAIDGRIFGTHGGTYGFIVTNDISGVLQLHLSTGTSSWDVASSLLGVTSLVQDQWHHVAFEWDGEFFDVYLDGGLEIRARSTTPMYIRTGMQLGAYNTGDRFQGFIDEFRFTSLDNRYGTYFDKPTSVFVQDLNWYDTNARKMKYGGPSDGWTEKIRLFLADYKFSREWASHLHMDWSSDTTVDKYLVDEYGNDWLLTGTAKLEDDDGTNTAKFGTRFLWLDGNSDFAALATANQLSSLGDGAWIIDCWFHMRSLATSQTIIAGVSTYTLRLYYLTGTNKMQIYLSNNGSSWDIASAVVGIKTGWSINTWYHAAFSFDGSTYRVFIDGVIDITVTDSKIVYSPINGFRVGASPGPGTFLNGGVDEFRFLRGHAIHTSNFTPPTSAYDSAGGLEQGKEVLAPFEKILPIKYYNRIAEQPSIGTWHEHRATIYNADPGIYTTILDFSDEVPLGTQYVYCRVRGSGDTTIRSGSIYEDYKRTKGWCDVRTDPHGSYLNDKNHILKLDWSRKAYFYTSSAYIDALLVYIYGYWGG